MRVCQFDIPSNTICIKFNGRKTLLWMFFDFGTSWTTSLLTIVCCSPCYDSLSFTSSDFKPFSSSSFFHCLPTISFSSGMSLASTAFLSLYRSIVRGCSSNELMKFRTRNYGYETFALPFKQPFSDRNYLNLRFCVNLGGNWLLQSLTKQLIINILVN